MTVARLVSRRRSPAVIMHEIAMNAWLKEILRLWPCEVLASPRHWFDYLLSCWFKWNIFALQIWAAAQKNWFTADFIGQRFLALLWQIPMRADANRTRRSDYSTENKTSKLFKMFHLLRLRPNRKDLRIPRVRRSTKPDRSTQLQRARKELNRRNLLER